MDEEEIISSESSATVGYKSVFNEDEGIFDNIKGVYKQQNLTNEEINIIVGVGKSVALLEWADSKNTRRAYCMLCQSLDDVRYEDLKSSCAPGWAPSSFKWPNYVVHLTKDCAVYQDSYSNLSVDQKNFIDSYPYEDIEKITKYCKNYEGYCIMPAIKSAKRKNEFEKIQREYEQKKRRVGRMQKIVTSRETVFFSHQAVLDSLLIDLFSENPALPFNLVQKESFKNLLQGVLVIGQKFPGLSFSPFRLRGLMIDDIPKRLKRKAKFLFDEAR